MSMKCCFFLKQPIFFNTFSSHGGCIECISMYISFLRAGRAPETCVSISQTQEASRDTHGRISPRLYKAGLCTLSKMTIALACAPHTAWYSGGQNNRHTGKVGQRDFIFNLKNIIKANINFKRE